MAAPTIAPNTADAHSFSTDQPTIEFTGTDADSDDLEYEIEICDDQLMLPVSPEIRSSSQNSSSSGSPSVSAPAGAQVGDKMIVIVTANGQTTISDNNGSTPFTEDINDYKPNTSNGNTISVFSRIIEAGDPSTYNFSVGATGRNAAIAICLKGGQYDVAPNTANAANDDSASTGTISAPAITVADNSIHIVVCTWDTGAIGTITTPSGYTLIENANGGGEPLHASKKDFATGASTGAVSIVNTEYGAMIAFSFSVKSKSLVYINALSDTDAGFANEDTPADTHPFNSGDLIGYTVQSGDALADGTYYQRERTKDPGGSNTWSSWTTTRSFDVSTSGGTSYDKTVSETLTTSDSSKKASSRTISEVSSISPSAIKVPSKRFSVSFSTSATISRGLLKNFSEVGSIVASSSLYRSTAKSISDIVVSVDSVIKFSIRSVYENQSVSDSISVFKVALKSISESITVISSNVRYISRNIVDTAISFADSVSKITSRTLESALSISESISQSLFIARSFVESFSLSETIRRAMARTLSVSLSFTPSISISFDRLVTVYKKLRGIISSAKIRGGIKKTSLK